MILARWSSLNHIAIKSRGPIQIMGHLTPVYLTHSGCLFCNYFLSRVVCPSRKEMIMISRRQSCVIPFIGSFITTNSNKLLWLQANGRATHGTQHTFLAQMEKWARGPGRRNKMDPKRKRKRKASKVNMWVLSGLCIHVLQLLSIRFTQRNLCWVLRFTMNHQSISDLL